VRARAALILSADLETKNLRVLGALSFTKLIEQGAYVGVIALRIALQICHRGQFVHLRDREP
jgi:hypothetical protein